jgi:hypothetical protein
VVAAILGQAAWFGGAALSVGTGLQDPTKSLRLQAEQLSAHAESQHTPSAQLPEAQSDLAEHVSPRARIRRGPSVP